MTEWSDYVYYHCRFPRCNEPCINRIDTQYTQTKSCRDCFTEELLEEQDPPVDHLLWVTDSEPDAPATAGEATKEPAVSGPTDGGSP
jgi:hypothetical protein